MKARVVRVELAAHAHATESVEKVEKALVNLVPPEARPRVKIVKSVMEGHYSNPITRITAVVEGGDAEALLRHLASMLDEREKAVLEATLESRYDEREGRLYIRLGKQEAYLGKARLLEGDDVVRLVVVFQGSPRLSEVRELLRSLGVLV